MGADLDCIHHLTADEPYLRAEWDECKRELIIYYAREQRENYCGVNSLLEAKETFREWCETIRY